MVELEAGLQTAAEQLVTLQEDLYEAEQKLSDSENSKKHTLASLNHSKIEQAALNQEVAELKAKLQQKDKYLEQIQEEVCMYVCIIYHFYHIRTLITQPDSFNNPNSPNSKSGLISSMIVYPNTDVLMF